MMSVKQVTSECARLRAQRVHELQTQLEEAENDIALLSEERLQLMLKLRDNRLKTKELEGLMGSIQSHIELEEHV